MNIIHDPGRDHLLSELYAFVSVVGQTRPSAYAIYAMTSSLSEALKLKPIMKEVAQKNGKKVLLVKFSQSEVIESL